jgi:UDP-N-acetylmuramyl tripeptide synthase
VAEWLDPAILAELRAELGQVVVVLGTNGKTTTTRLIAQIVDKTTSAPVTNRSGANLRQGLITAMIADRRPRTDGARRHAVLEVDEMAFGAVVDALRPDVIVVLNLLRDQLDRYGELDMIEDRWVRDLTGLPAETAIVVCADDPRLESVARRVARARRSRRPIARFGINATGPAASDLEPSVGRDRGGLGTPGVASCPACGGGLVYEGAASAGLGAWACPSCGAHRAALDLAVAIEGVDRDGWLELAFTPRAHDDVPRVRSLRVRLTGTAGAYDAAAAILAARAFGIRWDDAMSALDGATPAFGRMEEMAVGDRSVILTLAKNPASMVQAVNAAAVRHPDALVIALGDRPADGRDVSWIWDTELDQLPVCPLTLTGSRADDLALRFKYGAEDEVRGQEGRPMIVAPTLERAVDVALDRVGKGGTLMILATYTTLLDARTVLRQRIAGSAAEA